MRYEGARSYRVDLQDTLNAEGGDSESTSSVLVHRDSARYDSAPETLTQS